MVTKEGRLIKMIYAIIESKNNNPFILVADNTSEYISKTFNPELTTVWCIDSSRPPKGNSYKVKQKRLLSKAHNYKYLLTLYPHLKAYAANDNIADYFHKYGKKYGLLREFQGMRII